jgi:hypothetical protein
MLWNLVPVDELTTFEDEDRGFHTHHIPLSHSNYDGARAHSTQSGEASLPPRQ